MANITVTAGTITTGVKLKYFKNRLINLNEILIGLKDKHKRHCLKISEQ
jgi:hypothetical protein